MASETETATPATDVRASAHFGILLYPFRHALAGRARADRLDALSPTWLSWYARVPADDFDRVLDDTWFFLPAVRSLLFPETEAVAGLGPADAAQALRQKLHGRAAHEKRSRQSPYDVGVLRITTRS